MNEPEHAPTDTVKRFYALLAAGDAPLLLALLHDELEWTESERFPYYSGTWRSPAEVAEKLLVPVQRDWSSFTPRADDFVVEGNRVVALGVYEGIFRATGRALSAEFAHLWTVENGKIASFKMYTDTAKVLEAMRP